MAVPTLVFLFRLLVALELLDRGPSKVSVPGVRWGAPPAPLSHPYLATGPFRVRGCATTLEAAGRDERPREGAAPGPSPQPTNPPTPLPPPLA